MKSSVRIRKRTAPFRSGKDERKTPFAGRKKPGSGVRTSTGIALFQNRRPIDALPNASEREAVSKEIELVILQAERDNQKIGVDFYKTVDLLLSGAIG